MFVNEMQGEEDNMNVMEVVAREEYKYMFTVMAWGREEEDPIMHV